MSILRNFNLLRVIADAFRDVDTQYPMPADSDSTYAKDVWVDESTVTDWVDLDASGDDVAIIPFNNLHTRIRNSTADNPKTLLIHFKRTINAHQVGIGANGGGDFSNVFVKLLGSGSVVRNVFDDSANNTKYTSRNYPFDPELFNALLLEFHTADPVTISNITIQKSRNVAARIQGLRADNTIGDVSVTNGNNLKVSIEELESGISVNGNTQQKVTVFNSAGDEICTDPVCAAVVTVQQDHYEIHKGNGYRVCAIQTGVAAAGNTDLVLTTGSVESHAIFYGAAGADATLNIYEAATITGGTGSPLTIYNKNRNSLNTSANSALLNPTVTVVGTLLQPLFIPGGSGPTASGGVGAARSEWELKPSTVYLLRLTNNAATPQTLNPAIEWYEEPV